MSVYVSSEDLREQIRTGEKLTILAALWDAREGHAWSKFQSEHIPTALFCEPSLQLVGMPGSQVGRNPLPTLDRLIESFRGWGSSPAVPWSSTTLGRVFSRLARGGRCGGPAWRASASSTVDSPRGTRAATKRSPAPAPSLCTRSRRSSPGRCRRRTLRMCAATRARLSTLREPSRFRGQRERLDLKSGHIPGARNLPVESLFDDSGKILDNSHILEQFAKLGITHDTDPASAIAYSGSGNHSAKLLAAMAHVGLPVLTHCIGGWSQWSADASNPVEREV